MTIPPAERSLPPIENSVLAAYQQLTDPLPGTAGLPIAEQITLAISDLPIEIDPDSKYPLQERFRIFGSTLLASSSDGEELEARARFLFSPELREYYSTGNNAYSIKQRLALKTVFAIDMGLGGLAGYIEQHSMEPEAQQEAVAHFVAAFKNEDPNARARYSQNLVKTLVFKLRPSVEDFQFDYRSGYFNSSKFTDRDRLVADCLAAAQYGEKAAAKPLGAIAVHAALFGTLNHDSTQDIRRFNHHLTTLITHKAAGSLAGRSVEYAGIHSPIKSFQDAHNMVRRLASFVHTNLGSAEAGQIAGFLPEITEIGTDEHRRIIVLANSLTETMNDAYFRSLPEAERLQHLGTNTLEFLPQAFDRLLYVLGDLAKAQNNQDTSTSTEEAQGLVDAASDTIHLLVDHGLSMIEARNPITVADIVTMYQKESPELVAALIDQARNLSDTARAKRMPMVYQAYREQVRRTRALRYNMYSKSHGGFMT